MISLFCQDLRNFPAERARRLNAQFGIARVFALVWHEYLPPVDPIPRLNREQFERWQHDAGVPLWGWFNARADQNDDAAQLVRLTSELSPALSGWSLDIEGTWVKGAKLTTLLEGARLTGLPVFCSFAGATSSHVELDYRGVDQAGYAIDWQAYFDSGEGPTPADAVRELYQSSFVIPGWEYRTQLGKKYGWSKVGNVLGDPASRFEINAYQRAGAVDGTVKCRPRGWGVDVDVDRAVYRGGVKAGMFMGRAAYKNIRVTLDVTRGADQKHSPAEWAAIAASARVPGSAKRPVSVYLAENATDETLAGIAAGAG